ncbi:hypothetical protein JH314_08185 [Xanthomonas campestris]|uniref:hypothetical protein n=1 Tax=Xanthomonas campestris TaxID=339 RepID=UPI002368E8C7|nr:hypothetical protein [Xanthomonas campestris]WDJ03368.1 hypothetical protein JH314_08185 [Xanthomonas campestris]
MNKEEEIPVSPISGWDISAVKAYGAGLVTFKYLVSPMESVAQAHTSPTYALMPPQLRELARALTVLAEELESSPTTSEGSPQH